MTKPIFKFTQKHIVILVFIIIFGLAFSIEPLNVMFAGYRRILTSSSVLLSDFLLIGGLAATLFNVGTTTGLNILILKVLKVKIDGAVFACLLTIAGFAFFGKNLYNALPMYFGIFLYAKATKTKCRDHVLVFLLSSGISPITSFMIFGTNLPLAYGILLGVGTGIIVGFILPAFNVFAMKFHQGYNLYNTGFSMGVISMLLSGILSTFGIDILRSTEMNNDYHLALLIATIVISVFFIIFAFLDNPGVLKGFKKIMQKSGKLLTDFAGECGKDATLFNIGIMGLICVLLIVSTGIMINGPVMGAILTILGFSAFGKHPLNSIPVIVGAILAIELTPLEWTIGPTLSVLFVTGLAPIAGQFGILPGIMAGFIHLLITPMALEFQGGFDLYNNGFAAGFVAAVLVPVFSAFFKAKDDGGKWNRFIPLRHNWHKNKSSSPPSIEE